MTVTARPKPRLMVIGPNMQALCMPLGSLDSDADASVVIAIHRQSSPMAQTAMKLYQSQRH